MYMVVFLTFAYYNTVELVYNKRPRDWKNMFTKNKVLLYQGGGRDWKNMFNKNKVLLYQGGVVHIFNYYGGGTILYYTGDSTSRLIKLNITQEYTRNRVVFP